MRSARIAADAVLTRIDVNQAIGDRVRIDILDPEVATVDGKARGWWIYGHVAPAGGVIINRGDP
jgi:hypothetical protein